MAATINENTGNKTENVSGISSETVNTKKDINAFHMTFSGLGNFANDAAAAAGGVAVGELYYQTATGILMKRVV